MATILTRHSTRSATLSRGTCILRRARQISLHLLSFWLLPQVVAMLVNFAPRDGETAWRSGWLRDLGFVLAPLARAHLRPRPDAWPLARK
jgi:hypothetical protein